MENKFEGMETRTIIKMTRHKAELPLRIIAIALSCIIFILIGFVAQAAQNDVAVQEELATMLEGEDESTAAIAETIVALGIGCSIVMIGGLALVLLFAFYKQYAQIMSYSIKVTPTNFPEIYEKGKEFTEKLGLKKMPEIYVEQDNGALNAFATYVIGKRYVKLNAEIVDVAYLENKDFDTVFFVMAHEFGHIYLHHVTLLYNLFVSVAKAIPIYGPLLSRAQEFSADRVGQALTDNKNSEKCMVLMAGGRHLYKYIDINDYLASAAANHNALERFSRFIVNLLASHPITPFRTAAIMDPDRKSGRLL